jgi:hypothetical protein
VDREHAEELMPNTTNPDPLYTNERRRRFTRRYFLASGSAGTTLGALPTGGQRTVGSTILCQAPILTLTTGVGANRIVQVCEQHGQDMDLFTTPNGETFWDHDHYTSCRMAHGSGTPFANPTATMYAGLEMVAYLTTAPFPPPPGGLGADPAVHLRARLDTGAWELLQDNGLESRVDVLKGVAPFNTESIPTRLEIYYSQDRIEAAIDGVISRAPVHIMRAGIVAMSHVGAGVFITSGTDAAGNVQMYFYDVIADTVMPD